MHLMIIYPRGSKAYWMEEVILVSELNSLKFYKDI